MRVLIVETTMFGYDGITSVVTNYYKYQDHKRVQMDFVTINPISESFEKELTTYGGKSFVLPCRNKNPIEYIVRLTQIIKSGAYQIVHVHGCSATMAVELLAAKLAGVKIRIAHSHNTTCNHVIFDKILRPLFNICCNVGFACGKEAGEWMFPTKEYFVISNGVDLEQYQYSKSVREEMRIKYNLQGHLVIGHIGRMTRQKNHSKVIEIFEQISCRYDKAKLVLVGDGELKDGIEAKVAGTSMDVLFVGISNEVDRWLQAMDIIVFPSLYEGLPLVLVEAQAAGIPCILSDRISPEVKITDLVEFVSLDEDLSKWIEAIDRNINGFDREARVDFVKQQVQGAHFDIRKNCEDLADKYEMLVRMMG